MAKRVCTEEERIKKYNSLNKNIFVLSTKKEKWGRKLLLRCKKCGKEWEITTKGYILNPTCPNCREKKPNSPQCGKKLSNNEWIARAKSVHPEYLYDKANYINSWTSLIVTCPVHGDFSIPPKAFMKPDYKCAKCKKEEKLENEGKKFIEECKKIHPEYDYSKTKFYGIKSKMLITCPEHGDFWQLAKYNIEGCGCPKCSAKRAGENRKIDFDEFLKRSKDAHGDKYDYSKVEYIEYETPVCIICPEHGEFWQTPKEHSRGAGCPRCGGSFNYTQDEIIERFKSVHGDKYDYSKVNFKNTHDKVCIICHQKDEFGNEHGEFWQTPKNHLKYGCKKCSNVYMDTELFTNKANKIHGEKYDYSKVVYEKSNKKVCIICPEHGEFWQAAGSHINGRGCPLCKTSHLEKSIDQVFSKLNRLYVYQYHDKSIFGQQSLDFYFPSLKLGVECQGEQHYIANFFKSKGIEYAEEHLKYIQELDSRKRQLCKENGVELIYFAEPKFAKYETSGNRVFTDVNELIEYIKNKKIE